MNAWLVLLAVLGLCVAVAIGVGAAIFLSFRRPWRARCPRDGAEAQVQVDAVGAARSEVAGARRLSIERCSHRTPLKGCDQACLDLPAEARHVVGVGDPPLPVVGTPAVLVPLDGTRGSEAALPAALARAFDRAPALVDVVVTRDTLSSDLEKGLSLVPDYQPLTAWENAERERLRADARAS